MDLIELTEKGKINYIRDCLEHCRIFEDEKEKALNVAATKGYLQIVELFLDTGFNPNKGIRSAALNNQLKVVKLLVDRGANFLDEALYEAAKYEYSEIVKFLIEKGANVYTLPDELRRRTYFALPFLDAEDYSDVTKLIVREETVPDGIIILLNDGRKYKI